MLRVVVDTNIWVSTFIKPDGYYASLLQEIIKKGELFTAEEILAEAREVVLRPHIKDKYHLSESSIDRAITEARGFTTLITDLPDLDVIVEDPDDNIILACALKAQADYLLSYDPHLTDLGEYQGIQILTPKQFQAILKGLDED
jgi:putative PIN family toxin of toxin-antitoxin system